MDVLRLQPEPGGQAEPCWGDLTTVSPQNAQNSSGRPKPGFLAVFPPHVGGRCRYRRTRPGAGGAGGFRAGRACRLEVANTRAMASAPGRFSGDKWMHFQYVSTLLVDAVERGLLPVGAVVSACGTGTGVAGFARIRRLSLQLRLQRLLVPVVGGNSLSAQHLLEELH